MTKKRFFFYCIVTVLLIAIILLSPALTFAEAEQERLDRIAQNCSSIKVQLSHIQKNDTRNRVQLGSYFESINADLMLNLNLRLIKNNIADPELTTMQSDFASERERFKNDYIGYSQELEALIAIDCKTNPEEFSERLDKTRAKRADVYESISRLNETLDKHKAIVEQLKEEL